MKYSKLKALLLNVDKNSFEEDLLVNLNEEVAMKFRSNYGGNLLNGTCESNRSCSGNNVCSNQDTCSGNDVCNRAC